MYKTNLYSSNILARPSLRLAFAADKSLPGIVTFTRASSGTYFDSSGVMQTASTDVARFTHDPATGQSLGLLIEESRTNILTYSEEFDNAAWTKTDCSISANSETAPDGASTMDSIVENTASAARDVRQTLSNTAGTYSQSIYAKDNGRVLRIVVLCNANASYIYCDFDLSSGSVGTIVTNGGGISAYSAEIKDVGGGIYRCSILATYATDLSLMLARIVPSLDYDISGAYTGDGTSGIYIWGAQLEAGSSPTSYIKTTSSSVTRAADVPLLTGGNFSSVVDITKGSLIAAYRSIGSGARPIVSIDDDSTNNQFQIYTSTLDPKFTVVSGGSTVADLDAGTITADADSGIAAAYAVNDYAASSNGGAAVTDTSGALPVSPTTMRIGHDKAGNYLNGPLASLKVYPTRLSNSYLEFLS